MEANKLIKVLVLNGSPNDAPSFYRTYPFFKMRDVEPIQSLKVDWHTILPVDIVYVPRPYTINMVSVVNYAKLCKKPTWLDFDDSHFDIEPHNPAYTKLASPEALECTKKCIDMADIVTVSTEGVRASILEQCPTANIVVIPNAVDDTLFDLSPKQHERNKIVLWRGGPSHQADLDCYKDIILQLIKFDPSYKWVFMGSKPTWIDEIPEDRRAIYPYTDIMQYFQDLMDLKPELMIVPLEDNQFNRCKSAISLFEGALSGASVLATNLPEFNTYGAALFNNSEDLQLVFSDLTEDKEIRDFYYECHLENIPRLSGVNKLRMDVLNGLMQLNPKF